MGTEEKWYTIYNAETDEFLCCGTGRECSKFLDMTLASFHSMICRTKNGTNKKYEVLIEPLRGVEENDYD